MHVYIKLARLNNSILPVIGLVTGFVATKAENYAELTLAIIALVLVHSVLTIWNDIADEAGDRFNNISRIGLLRQTGAYRRLLALLFCSLAAIVAIMLFLPNSTKALICVSLLLGWAYNVPPIHASHRPILSVVVLALAYGSIPFLIGASLGRINLAGVGLLIGWTIGRGSLLMLKDYKDARGDMQAEKRTFLLVYGGKSTARLSFGLAFIGYFVSTIAVGIDIRRVISLAPLCLVAIWLLYERSRLFRERRYEGLNKIFHECVLYQILFDGLVAVCLRTL